MIHAGETLHMDDNTFRGEIRVASRIIDYLSSGLYESPAACLKELVNNSYDADATRVNMFVKPDADRIIIEDDGHGMNRTDFIRHFGRISESYKREDSDATESGRPKIGKIGIGFIAANEICDVLEIVSTKADSTELLRVSINFREMREDTEDRRRERGDLAKADYEGEVLKIDAESHFTQVFLEQVQVRGKSKEILAGARTQGHTSGEISLYGLSESSIKRELRKPTVKSWAAFDSYSQTILKVALNVPVAYYDDWLPLDLLSEVDDLYREAKALDFSLYVDGSHILKPILFTPEDSKALLSRFDFTGEHMSAKGYFYAQHKTIRPEDLQGLLIRIRNAAVGDYDHSFLGFSPSEGPILQRWISAEIWADDGLEDAMNIDRRTLRVAHPAYVELRDAVHEHLSKFLKEVRSKLYGEGSRIRNRDRAQTVVGSIERIADETVAPVAPAAATEMKQLWTRAAGEDKGVKRILQKYSVAELYRITLEIAAEILTPEQRQEFVKRLTNRLSK